MSQLVFNKTYIEGKHPTDIDSFFDYFINIQQPSSAILVLPTGKYVRWAKKKFLQKYFKVQKKPSTELHFYRLMDFAKKCLLELAPEKKYKLLSDTAILSLMEDAAKNVNLSYFSKDNKNIL